MKSSLTDLTEIIAQNVQVLEASMEKRDINVPFFE